MIDLQGRVAWVTGGAEGLGLSITKMFSDLGARVAITAQHQDTLDKAAKRIDPSGEKILVAPGDVREHERMDAIAGEIIDRWGKIDIVVANAGINGTWAPLERIDPADWRQTIEINLLGTYHTIRAALPSMKERQSGSIVIVSSVNGTRTFSNEGASAYASSKAAQLALGQMLALELANFKIRVNVICPGAFDTGIHDKTKRFDLEEIEIPVEFPEGQIPLTHGDMGKPYQVAQLTAFLASDAASHITGTPVWIDGGQSLL